MTRRIITLVLGLGLVATGALAAEARKPRPVACEDFSTAKTTGGQEVALCVSAKGKPSVLRSFALVTVKDPDGNPVRLAVGFR